MRAIELLLLAFPVIVAAANFGAKYYLRHSRKIGDAKHIEQLERDNEKMDDLLRKIGSEK